MLWWLMKMVTVSNYADEKSNQTNSEGEASVIHVSKFELCTLDEQVLGLGLSVDTVHVAPYYKQGPWRPLKANYK